MAPVAAASFEQLLTELRELHEREMDALRSEVKLLQMMRRADSKAAAPDMLPARSNAGNGSAGTMSPPLAPVIEDRQVTFPEPKRKESAVSRTTSKHTEVSLLDRNSPLTARLRAFLTSDRYELAVGITIMANIVVMAADVQYRGLDIGYDLGYRWFDSAAEDVWPGGLMVITILDYVFLGLFTIDLVMCLTVLKSSFFRSGFNLLDLVVVATGWVEVVSSFLPIPPMLMRMLRLLKFGRALRAVQLSRVSQSLKILRTCIASSVEMLFWSLCLLGVIQCVGGMMISVLVRPYLEDDNFDIDTRKKVFRYYGTFSSTTLSMFETLFANWAVPCRVLVDHVSEWYSLWFIFYRCLIGFAVLNVVNACFVQRTMAVGQQDTELMIDNKEKEKERYARKLNELFYELDSSGDGLLEWEEFYQLVTDERLRAYMSALEIDWNDLSYLFEVMSNGTGYISIADFTASASRVRGAAKGIDMANLLGICRRLEDTLQVMNANVSQDPGGHVSPRVEGARRREGRRSVVGLPGGMPKGAFFGGIGALESSPSRQQGSLNHLGAAGPSTMSASQSSSPAAPPGSTRGGETGDVRGVEAEFSEDAEPRSPSTWDGSVSTGWANGGETKPSCGAWRQTLWSSLEEASANRRLEVPEEQFHRSKSEDSEFDV